MKYSEADIVDKGELGRVASLNFEEDEEELHVEEDGDQNGPVEWCEEEQYPNSVGVYAVYEGQEAYLDDLVGCRDDYGPHLDDEELGNDQLGYVETMGDG